MWLPSLRKKFLTQPTWSDGSPFSMLDSPTAGCQAQWLLKSRNTCQTRAIGASITAERLTRITLACFLGTCRLARLSPQQELQRVEPRLEDVLTDAAGQLSFL